MDKAKKVRTRALLKAVIKELNHGNRELWWVLTALRGPDSGSDTLKDKTTAVIRAIVGLKQGPSGAIVAKVKAIRKPNYTDAGYGHFAGHVANAINALEDLGYKFTKL